MASEQRNHLAVAEKVPAVVALLRLVEVAVVAGLEVPAFARFYEHHSSYMKGNHTDQLKFNSNCVLQGQ